MSETTQFPVTTLDPGSHNGFAEGELAGKTAGDRLARAVMAHLKGDAGAALTALQPDAPGVAETPETVAARAHLFSEAQTL